MSKLIRRNSQGEIVTEEISDETEKAETVQVDEPLTIKTSEGKMPVSYDQVQLKCNRCEKVIFFTRNLEVNLLCPECGNDNFLSLSTFRMEGENSGIAVNLHDKVTRRYGVWKLV